MKHLHLFESHYIDNYTCKECNWIGSIEVIDKNSTVGIQNSTTFTPIAKWTDKIITCPQCHVENDVWEDGEEEPLRHKLKNLLSYGKLLLTL